MSQYAWESILVRYFETIKGLDAEIEGIRQEVCMNIAFVPQELFNVLDNDSKAFLSLNDFKSFLSSKHVQYEEESLRKFIHNFDKDNDFSINYNEFLNIVLPRNNFSLKSDTEQRRPKDQGDRKEIQQRKEIDAKTELGFIKLIQMELDLVQQLAQIADELQSSKDFTTYEAFLAIVHDCKYITEANLEIFLKDNKLELQLNDISTLLFRLDSDLDGKISYEEFQEIFFPYKIFSSSYSRKSTQRQQQQFDRSNRQSERIIDKNCSIDMKESSLVKPRYQTNQYEDQSNRNYSNKINEINKSLEDIEPRYDNNLLLGSTNVSSFKESNNMNDKRDFVAQTNRIMDKGINSSPRRETKLMNMELDHRARLNTYACIDDKHNSNILNQNKQLSFSPNQRRLSPVRFDKSPMRNQIRTEVKLSPLRYEANEQNSSYYPSSSCCCCHLTSCCSCCCNESQKIFNLFNLLNDFATQDAKIEVLKEELAFCSDANLTDLFAFFDISHRETIGPIDLTEALKQLGLSIPLSDSKLIYKSYDKNLDGRFDYGEFCEMILPKKYEIAKLINNRLPSAYFLGFNYQTKTLLSNLFSSLIEAELSHERYRCILSTTPNSSIFDSFNKLKSSYSSGIYKEDIIRFFEENGATLSTFQTELLMDRLDKNQDGIISYNEFIYQIAPQY